MKQIFGAMSNVMKFVVLMLMVGCGPGERQNPPAKDVSPAPIEMGPSTEELKKSEEFARHMSELAKFFELRSLVRFSIYSNIDKQILKNRIQLSAFSRPNDKGEVEALSLDDSDYSLKAGSNFEIWSREKRQSMITWQSYGCSDEKRKSFNLEGIDLSNMSAKELVHDKSLPVDIMYICGEQISGQFNVDAKVIVLSNVSEVFAFTDIAYSGRILSYVLFLDGTNSVHLKQTEDLRGIPTQNTDTVNSPDPSSETTTDDVIERYANTIKSVKSGRTEGQSFIISVEELQGSGTLKVILSSTVKVPK